jgi:hypothetical protein
MLKASQQQVVQQTNLNLVQIRTIEIQYFSNFFTNFGTQCILLGGFICGAISQTPSLDRGVNYFFIILYNLGSAGCVAFAVQALIGSIYISVFGQGRALRGPLGSMVTTVEGMVEEQKTAVLLFIGAVTCFVLQEIGMYWLMMDQVNAIACSIITLIASLLTYRAALRIYNRFYWNAGSIKFHANRDEDDLDELNPEPGGGNKTLNNNSNSTSNSPMNKQKIRSSASDNGTAYLPKSSNGGKRGGGSVLGRMFANRNNNNNNQEQNEAERLATRPTQGNGDDFSVMSDTPYMNMADQVEAVDKSPKKLAGYLTVKLKKTLRDPWERRYFILRNKLIYYYKDKRSCELDPNKPLNSRPINLEGYGLVAGAKEPPYAISLVPTSEDDIRKAWKFRCDTVAEFSNWVEMLQAALAMGDIGLSGHTDIVDVLGGDD